jgi:hypothetical protein
MVFSCSVARISSVVSRSAGMIIEKILRFWPTQLHNAAALSFVY